MSLWRPLGAAVIVVAVAGAALAQAYSGAGPSGGINVPGIGAKVGVFREPGQRPVFLPDANPPDPTGAIGEGYYVQATNGHVAVFRRRGMRRLSETSLSRFFGSGTFISGDPQIAWDPGADRWLFAGHGIQTNTLYYGWSKSADPSRLGRGWCRFGLPQGGLLPDFPRLGFSSDLILIGLNMGDKKTGTLPFSRLIAIAKPARGDRACAKPEVSTFGGPMHPLRGADGLRAGTPVPAMSHSASGEGWVVSAHCLEESPPIPDQEDCATTTERARQLTVWRLGGTPTAPTLTRTGAVAVPTFRPSPPIPQPGTNQRIDASDTRLTQAITENDPSFGGVEALWTAHTVGAGGRAAVRWYEIDPSNRSLLRTGLLDSPRFSTAFGAIAPTARGDSAVVNYVLAGRRLRLQIRARYRGAGDPPGSLRRMLVLARSPSALRNAEFECDGRPPVCRYGDYNAAVPDPDRANVIWGTNELNGPGDPRAPLLPTWRTRIFAIASPPGG